MAKANKKKVAKKSASAKKPAAKKAVSKNASAPAKKAQTSNSKPKSAPMKKAGVVSKSPAKSKSSAKIDWENFVTPLDDRLIVEMHVGERVTAGGLILPDTVSDTSGNFKGTVLVAGRGHLDKKGRVKPMDVKPGDEILFSEYSGAKIELQGQELRILRESEVLGIVDKK